MLLARVGLQVSFHRYGDYFPGTGAIDDVGFGQGKGYCVNVPLKDGMDDESYRYVYEPIMTKVCVYSGILGQRAVMTQERSSPCERQRQGGVGVHGKQASRALTLQGWCVQLS